MSKGLSITIIIGVIIIALYIIYGYKTQLSNVEAELNLQKYQQQEVNNISDTIAENNVGNTSADNTANNTTPKKESLVIEDELVQLSEDLNKKIPIKIGDTSEITKISVSGRKITCSLKATGKYFITQSFLDRTMKKILVDNFCNNQPIIRYYLEKGATLILDYYNGNDKLGGTVTVKLSDCK
jgi:hypothetical protein